MNESISQNKNKWFNSMQLTNNKKKKQTTEFSIQYALHRIFEVMSFYFDIEQRCEWTDFKRVLCCVCCVFVYCRCGKPFNTPHFMYVWMENNTTQWEIGMLVSVWICRRCNAIAEAKPNQTKKIWQQTRKM